MQFCSETAQKILSFWTSGGGRARGGSIVSIVISFEEEIFLQKKNLKKEGLKTETGGRHAEYRYYVYSLPRAAICKFVKRAVTRASSP